MATKVYKEWKLLRNEQGVFSKEFKTLRKAHTVIDEQLAEIYNSNTDSSGLFYELDEVKSQELEKDISRRMQERIARQTKVSYSIPEPKKEVVVEEKQKVIPIKESSEDREQKKYNNRKAKMIAGGWLFDEAKRVFTRDNELITAEKLLSASNILYGKLIKSK